MRTKMGCMLRFHAADAQKRCSCPVLSRKTPPRLAVVLSQHLKCQTFALNGACPVPQEPGTGRAFMPNLTEPIAEHSFMSEHSLPAPVSRPAWHTACAGVTARADCAGLRRDWDP